MSISISRKWVILVFMAGTFSLGMTEYVVTGLLTQIARDLKVEISTTGLLLSVYAISVAFFGPILRIFTMKISSRFLLISLISIFIVSNIIAATATSFGVLLFSRLLSASMHAPFFGLCMSLAVHISEPHRRTSAIALVQGGLTFAVMVGVPFGSYLGGMLNWRYVFLFMAILGLITLVGLYVVTPESKFKEAPQLKKELLMFKNKNILLVISIVIFGFSGVFTAYTFMEPMVREFAGFDVFGVTVVLLFFGGGAVVGNFYSGNVQEHNLTKYLMFTFIILFIVLLSFTFFLQFSFLAPAISFLFGAGTFGSTPLLNSKIILSAPNSPLLSGTIAASVFNIANFIGATLGTSLLNNDLSYTTITFIAAGIILFGLVLLVLTYKMENKQR